MSIYQNKLGYISGEPGTGKGNYIKRLISTVPGRYIVVQPTIELINEFAKDVEKSSVLHSESFQGDLLTEIHKHLAKPENNTIFITDKMFYKVDRYRMRGWKIFIDDSMNFCTVLARNKAQDNIEAIYKKIFILGKFIEIDGEGGELDKMYRHFEMCPREMVSDDMLAAWEYYNQLSDYHRRGILAKSLTTESDKIVVWGDYDIPAYADELDITYCANQFEYSCLYRAYGDKFYPVQYEKTHWKENNNQRIVMNYFLAGNRFGLSKNIMLTSPDIPVIEKWLNENVQNYYWTRNNDERITFSMDEDKKVAVVQRGRNNLKDRTSCVFMAAMNPSDTTVPHYENIWGITANDLRNEWTYETLNQFIYRGVIRDYGSTEVMNVYVYDEVTAHTINGAKYNHIDIGLSSTQKQTGRPKKFNDDKTLTTRFKNWKSLNGDKPNARDLFAKWRHKQEQYAEVHDLDWLAQLDRYERQI
jgi:hypothetical protein